MHILRESNNLSYKTKKSTIKKQNNRMNTGVEVSETENGKLIEDIGETKSCCLENIKEID